MVDRTKITNMGLLSRPGKDGLESEGYYLEMAN